MGCRRVLLRCFIVCMLCVYLLTIGAFRKYSTCIHKCFSFMGDNVRESRVRTNLIFTIINGKRPNPMEKKNLATIAAMLTMTVALSACGSTNDTSSSGATNSSSAVSSTNSNTDTNTNTKTNTDIDTDTSNDMNSSMRSTDTNTSSGTDAATPQAANDGRTGTPPQGTPPAGGPPEGTPPDGTPPEGAPPEGEGNPPSKPNEDQAAADGAASGSTSDASTTATDAGSQSGQ